MKRAIIVHCWAGKPDYCWYPQTKKDLEGLGFAVKVPVMPETEEPKLGQWLPKLEEVIGKPDEELVLIGHSVGCITILRYLESLGDNQQIGGVVFVAGFIDDLSYMDSIEEKDVLSDFFQTPVDYDGIKSKAKKFVAIHSDNDPFVELKHADVFKEKLGAEVIIKPGMQHFSGEVDDEKSCTSLPDVIDVIKKMKL